MDEEVSGQGAGDPDRHVAKKVTKSLEHHLKEKDVSTS